MKLLEDHGRRPEPGIEVRHDHDVHIDVVLVGQRPAPGAAAVAALEEGRDDDLGQHGIRVQLGAQLLVRVLALLPELGG